MLAHSKCRPIVLIVTLIFAGLPLMAQGYRGGASQAGMSLISTPPSLVTVSGTVQSVDFQYGEGYPNFELKAADGATYVVFVGPLRYLDDNDFEIREGDLLTASIFRDAQSNNAWVAAVLTNLTTGQSLTLRDASGVPLWMRRGSAGHPGFGSGPAIGAGSGPRMNQGQGSAALRAGQASIDLTTLATYAGTVTKVDVAAGETHPTIEVRLQSGTAALFCLGPWRYLDQIGLAVKVGDEVTVRAANCAQGDEEYVVFSITISGKTWVLRAEDGSPMWYFGRRG